MKIILIIIVLNRRTYIHTYYTCTQSQFNLDFNDIFFNIYERSPCYLMWGSWIYFNTVTSRRIWFLVRSFNGTTFINDTLSKKSKSRTQRYAPSLRKILSIWDCVYTALATSINHSFITRRSYIDKRQEPVSNNEFYIMFSQQINFFSIK